MARASFPRIRHVLHAFDCHGNKYGRGEATSSRQSRVVSRHQTLCHVTEICDVTRKITNKIK